MAWRGEIRLAVVAIVLAGCVSDVTTFDAHRLATQGARVLDVRWRSEYAERHVPGATNIPVDELQRRLDELGPHDRPIIVYCHTGVRAWIAASILRKAGFSTVYNLGTLGHWYKERLDPPPSLF
jgi:rhodanese-related sulfurtransferase